jgi:hypothetical protein
MPALLPLRPMASTPSAYAILTLPANVHRTRDVGVSADAAIYAGSLDDPSNFHPTIAIFAASRPHWAIIPHDVTVFDRMPP